MEHCEPVAFRAMLHFLYTDDLAHVGEFLAKQTLADARVCRLQELLGVCHKFHVCRLRLWCEHELIQLITVQDVCSVLFRAVMCEATQLEEACLKMLKNNLEKLADTSTFVFLCSEWPEVVLRLALSACGVSSSKAALCIKAQQENMRKRKRE